MKRDGIDLSEFGLDEELDFDFNDDTSSPPEIPKGREAIMEVAKSAGKGAANMFVGEGRRRQTVLNALPKDYSAGVEAYDVFADSGREFIRNAREDYDRTKREFRRTAKSALPLVKKFLPSSMAERLEKFSIDPNSSVDTQYDPRQAEMAAAMDQMNASFEESRASMEEKKIERIEDELREQINLDVNNKIHDLLANIGTDVSFMRAMGGSSINYRKKMIELNYRQVFALTDLIEITRQNMERLVPATEAVVKNTALPDYAKETTSEVAAAQFKRRMLNALSPSAFMADFGQRLSKNLTNTASGFFSGVSDSLSGINQAADAINTEREGKSDEQIAYEGKKKAGTLAGSIVGDTLLRPQLNKLNNKFRKYNADNDTALQRTGRKFKYYATTAPEVLNDMANDTSHLGDFSMKGAFKSIISDILPGYNGNSAILDGTDAASMSRAVPWTSRSDITVNDVIPGWLARIHQAIRQLGGHDAALETYDYEKREYVSSEELGREIQERLAPKSLKRYIRSEYDGIIDSLDKDKTLSEEERTLLGQILDSKMRGVSQFNIGKMAKDYEAFGKAGQGKDVGGIQALFRDIAGDESKLFEMNNMVSGKLSNLRTTVGSNQEIVENLRKVYGDKALVDAGIFTKNRFGRVGFNENINNSYVDDVALPSPQREAVEGQRQVAKVVGAVGAAAQTQGYSKTVEEVTDIKGGMYTADAVAAAMESVVPTSDIKETTRYITLIYDFLVQNNLKPTVENILESMGKVQAPAVSKSTVEEISSEGGKRSGKWGARAKRLGSAVLNHQKRSWGRFKKLSSGAMSTASGAVEASAIAGISAGKHALNWADIYDAAGNIVLEAKKLKGGIYHDAEGKIITKLSDIKGAVYENGQVVISEADIAGKLAGFTYYTKSGWKKAAEVVGGVGGKILNKLGGGLSTLTNIPRMGMAIAKAGVTGTFRRSKTTSDVYVKGEDTPRILRSKLLKGFYIDRETEKPIYSVDDIVGTVIDREGNIVIDAAEMAQKGFAFVGPDGEEIKSRFRKVASGIANVAVGAMRMVGGGLKKTFDAGKNAMGYVSGLVSDAVGSMWEARNLGKASKSNKKRKKGKKTGKGAIVDRLDKIYALLDKRMGPAKKTIRGDVDGDGIREGSYRDIMAKRRKARAEKEAAKKAGKKDTGKRQVRDGAAQLGGGVTSVVGGVVDSIKDMAGGVVDMATTAMGAKTAATVASTVAGGGTKAAVTTAGKTAATTVAKTVATSAARAGLMAGLSKVAMGAIGFISAPVALGVMAAAGVGYLAYKLATSETPHIIDQLRYAQYGAEDHDEGNSDEIMKIRFMEDLMGKYTSYDDNGIASISGLNEEVTTILYAGLDIEPDDEERVGMFRRFFMSRFAPVYLLWKTRVKQCTKDGKFGGFGKVPVEEIRALLDKVKLQDDHAIYRVTENVLKDSWIGDDILLGPGEVAEVMAKAMEWVEKQSKPRKKVQGGAGGGVSNYAKGIQGTVEGTKYGANHENVARGPGIANEKSVAVDEDDWYNDSLKNVEKLEDGKVKIGNRTFDNMAALKEARSNAKRKAEAIKRNTVGASEEVVVSVKTSGRSAANVSAYEAIRLKTYGLVKLEIDKIEIIYKLEEDFMKDVKADAGRASFLGDYEKLADAHMANFGWDPSKPEDRVTWIRWASGRFGPSLLKHTALVKEQSSNGNPLDFIVSSANGVAARKMASAIINAKVLLEGDVYGIWDVPYPAFKGLPIGKDPSIVEGNLTYLSELARRQLVNEQTAEVRKSEVSEAVNEQRLADKVAKASAGKDSKVAVSRADDFLAKVRADKATREGRPLSETPDGGHAGIPSDNIADDDESIGKGDYSSIKMTGDGRKDIADMLYQVSKLTGVDHNLLMTIAMVESSMKPNAGAKTSSAKGLFQFVDGTWTEQLQKWGNKYGIPSNASPYDPIANAILGAKYIQSGGKKIEKASGRKITAADAYLGHFMGHGGAANFHKAMAMNPNAAAADVFRKAAEANQPIFYERDGTPRTLKGVYDYLNRKMRANWSHVEQYARGSEPKNLTADAPDAQTAKAAPSVNGSAVKPEQAEIAALAKKQQTSADAKANAESIEPPPLTPKAKVPVAEPTSIARTSIGRKAADNEQKMEAVRKQQEMERAEFAKNNGVDAVGLGLESLTGITAQGTNAQLSAMGKQQQTLEQIALALQHLNGTMAKQLPETRENKQAVVENERETTKLAAKKPVVEHVETPISVSRQRA